MKNRNNLKENNGSSGIFNQIRSAIINGEYKFHERLPSERYMAIQYKVARGTIRSALEQLEKACLVRKKFSSGTYVCYDSGFEQLDIAEETSPLELIEARLAIEPHIVRLVVLNANNREIRKLNEVLDNVLQTRHNPNSFSTADEAFHLTLAKCSQNPLLIWMCQKINVIRSHTQWNHRKDNILTPPKISYYNNQHAQLVRFIIRRDIDKAVGQMVEHLHQAKRDLLGSTN